MENRLQNLQNILPPDDYRLPEPSYRHAAASNANTTSVWVFGYGSLIWHPGFDYRKCTTGYIRGYLRRFWQGNTTHRGTTEKPGRVATLVEDKEGITWGCAYQLVGESALEYLKHRECTLGGYVTLVTKFFPRVANADTDFLGDAYPVLVYIATPQNDLWLGEDNLHKIASQIVDCSGCTGHNVEYLVRLASFMRNEIPGVVDDHLFALEELVKNYLRTNSIALESVMGGTPEPVLRDLHATNRRSAVSFEYRSRVPETKLRCLHI